VIVMIIFFTYEGMKIFQQVKKEVKRQAMQSNKKNVVNSLAAE